MPEDIPNDQQLKDNNIVVPFADNDMLTITSPIEIRGVEKVKPRMPPVSGSIRTKFCAKPVSTMPTNRWIYAPPARSAHGRSPNHVIKIEELFSVRGKVAFITGGSRGLGEMIARAYVENGAKVYISARKADACEHLAKELSAFGTCIAIPGDLSKMDEIARVGAELEKREKKLDILVNNAGASWGAPFDEFPEQGWDKVMDLNVKSPFFLTQRLVKLLEAAGTQGQLFARHQYRLDRGHSHDTSRGLLVCSLEGRHQSSDAADGEASCVAFHRGQRDRARLLPLEDDGGHRAARRGWHRR